MFASSPERGSFLRGVLALSVKPCRACQLSQRESLWRNRKLYILTGNLAMLKPSGAVNFTA